MSGVAASVIKSNNGLGAGATPAVASEFTQQCKAGKAEIFNMRVRVSCKVNAASTMCMYLRACSTHLRLSCTHPQGNVAIDWVSNVDGSTDVSTIAKLICNDLNLLPEFVHLHHKGDLAADKLLLRQVDFFL